MSREDGGISVRNFHNLALFVKAKNGEIVSQKLNFHKKMRAGY